MVASFYASLSLCTLAHQPSWQLLLPHMCAYLLTPPLSPAPSRLRMRALLFLDITRAGAHTLSPCARTRARSVLRALALATFLAAASALRLSLALNTTSTWPFFLLSSDDPPSIRGLWSGGLCGVCVCAHARTRGAGFVCMRASMSAREVHLHARGMWVHAILMEYIRLHAIHNTHATCHMCYKVHACDMCYKMHAIYHSTINMQYLTIQYTCNIQYYNTIYSTTIYSTTIYSTTIQYTVLQYNIHAIYSTTIYMQYTVLQYSTTIQYTCNKQYYNIHALHHNLHTCPPAKKSPAPRRRCQLHLTHAHSPSLFTTYAYLSIFTTYAYLSIFTTYASST